MHPEGGWRWFELRGRALTRDDDGKPRQVLVVAIDVTERRAMARALDRATRAVLWAGEQERRRVARNLHESRPAQHLVAIDLLVEPGAAGAGRERGGCGNHARYARGPRAPRTEEIRTYSIFCIHGSCSGWVWRPPSSALSKASAAAPIFPSRCW